MKFKIYIGTGFGFFFFKSILTTNITENLPIYLIDFQLFNQNIILNIYRPFSRPKKTIYPFDTFSSFCKRKEQKITSVQK